VTLPNTDVTRQQKAPEIAQTTSKPATVALLNTAKYQRDSGKMRAAQSSLERALRISPKDPEVYYSLAEVHRRLGEFVQAEQVALKGVEVAAGQSPKLKRLWTLVAKVRAEAGDSAGAKKALQKSTSY
ncbi:MAG: tetratricopeptide repeat protein, partial [Pseudomonadales bacterium]